MWFSRLPPRQQNHDRMRQFIRQWLEMPALRAAPLHATAVDTALMERAVEFRLFPGEFSVQKQEFRHATTAVLPT